MRRVEHPSNALVFSYFKFDKLMGFLLSMGLKNNDIYNAFKPHQSVLGSHAIEQALVECATASGQDIGLCLLVYVPRVMRSGKSEDGYFHLAEAEVVIRKRAKW